MKTYYQLWEPIYIHRNIYTNDLEFIWRKNRRLSIPLYKNVFELIHANMEYQFTLDPFACTAYIVIYKRKAYRSIWQIVYKHQFKKLFTGWQKFLCHNQRRAMFWKTKNTRKRKCVLKIVKRFEFHGCILQRYNIYINIKLE